MSRYEAGETLSSIARTYDCSPPAISYIVSRSREKSANETATPPASEPQLIKTAANGSSTHDAPANDAATDNLASVEPTPPAAVPAAVIRREPASIAAPHTPPAGNGSANGNGATNGGAAANGDQRRTLHLFGNGGSNGHSNGNGNGNGNGHALAVPNGNGNGHDSADRSSLPPPPRQPQAPAAPLPAATGARPPQPPRNPPPIDIGRNGRDLFALPEGRPSPQQPRDPEPGRKDGGAFIDQELRSRVDGDIAAFLAAFDAALASDTQESRFGLREATDRLLRAGARTRIELERLEARVPLPPRDGAPQPEPTAWRYR